MRTQIPQRDSAGKAKNDDDAHRRARLPLHKKLLFSAATVVAFFAAVELLLVLCGFRAATSSDDPFVGFSAYSPLFVERASDHATVRMVTASGKLTWFNEQEFTHPKPSGVFRIFCLGGSTTHGRPHDDRTSFAGWLRELFAEADPQRKYEVINAGGVSYASYRVARLMEELIEYEPDLFIIYTGHNEFLERRTYADILDTSEAVRGAGALLARTRTYGAVRRIMRPDPEAKPEGDTLSTEVLTQLDTVVGFDTYHRDETFRRQVLAHFRFNLDRMIESARAASADVLLVTPASNLSGCSPFKSEHQASLSPGDLQVFHAALKGALQEYDRQQYEAALIRIEQALQVDNQYADAIYWRGRILLALGRVDEARSALVSARDEDVCPLRALSEIESLVREAADECSVPLVDFAAIVTSQSPAGIPGDELFLDHVHPTIEGHGLLAAALFEELAGLGVVEPQTGSIASELDAVATRIKGSIALADRAAALRNLSKVLGWAGKVEEAGKLALQAIELNPDDAEAQYLAGNALYSRGEFAAALERYQTSRVLDPESSETYYGLGLVHTDLGYVDEAIGYYHEALRLDPAFADAHYNLAQLLSERDEIELSERHFRVVLRIEPHHFEAANALGAVLAQQGRYDEAGRWFEQALQVNPRFEPAQENLQQLRTLQDR